jgi:hypothetical protein
MRTHNPRRGSRFLCESLEDFHTHLAQRQLVLRADWEKQQNGDDIWARLDPQVRRLHCYICQGEFFAMRSDARYCSLTCRRTADAQRKRRPVAALTQKHCRRCGGSFVARRADARYCSPACKQAAYRVRVTDNIRLHGVTGSISVTPQVETVSA